MGGGRHGLTPVEKRPGRGVTRDLKQGIHMATTRHVLDFLGISGQSIFGRSRQSRLVRPTGY
jgi:hypothetical protein